MIRITGWFAIFGLLSASLLAASFDCSKAKTTIEKTICGNPGLDQADSRLGRAYKQLCRLLSGAALKRIKMDQRAWLPLREVYCLSDDAKCLLGVYEERIRFLEYRLSPVFGSSPTGAISGQYSIGESMTLRVYPLSEAQVAITIDGAELTAALWICQYSGRGTLLGNLTDVSDTDGEKVRLLFSRNAVDVDEGNVVSRYCGARGTISGRYQKDWVW